MWRRRWVGAVLVLVAAGVAVLRCQALGDHSAGRLASGLQLVVRGIEGDRAAFFEAERELASASAFTDPYPLFVLEVTHRLRERRWDDASNEVQGVLAALADGRWVDARAAAHTLPADLAGRAELARLVSDLAAARLASPPPAER